MCCRCDRDASGPAIPRADVVEHRYLSGCLDDSDEAAPDAPEVGEAADEAALVQAALLRAVGAADSTGARTTRVHRRRFVPSRRYRAISAAGATAPLLLARFCRL